MSIATEITRIAKNVSDSLDAVAAKGVTVPSGSTSDDLADLISQIQSGSTEAISIVDTPDAAGGTVRTITALDISDTTAIAEDVASGKYFYTASGVKTQGTSSGGGRGGVGTFKDVNFIDYDGTILHSYTTQEAQALSTLPVNPSHTGLISQGWNWTLQDIKSQLTSVGGPVWVGQMYVTQSGDTEIDIHIPEGRLNPILTVSINGTITVNWGDNTTPNTVTGSNILITRQAVSHAYALPGEYTIKIKVENGEFAFFGGSGYNILRKGTGIGEDKVYTNCVRSIRLGNGITTFGVDSFNECTSLKYITIPSSITNFIGSVFNSCYSLKSITIPLGVTDVGLSTFSYCYGLTSIALPSSITYLGGSLFKFCTSLASVTIPNGVTSISGAVFSDCYSLDTINLPNTITAIGNSTFYNCHSLASITIPDGVTSIGDNIFYDCYSLGSIVLPSNVTSIGDYAFYNCYGLTSITIPNGVTSIGHRAFYECSSLESIVLPSSLISIGNYEFYSCYSLASVTIPSNVTSIGNYAFQYCYGMSEYHIRPTTPPTIGTSIFSGLPSDCMIYVPSASLENYKIASNWNVYESRMQGE